MIVFFASSGSGGNEQNSQLPLGTFDPGGKALDLLLGHALQLRIGLVFGEFAALFEFPFLRLEAMPRLDDSAKSCVFTRRLNGALLVFVEVRVGKESLQFPILRFHRCQSVGRRGSHRGVSRHADRWGLRKPKRLPITPPEMWAN
jgi:hypothetical protein